MKRLLGLLVFSVMVVSSLSVVFAEDKVATPTATPDGGMFTDMLNNSVIVTLSCETEGATIYYSLDSPGVDYPAEVLEYTEPITLTFTTTIRARAEKEGMEESEALEVTFTDDVFNGTVATPTATPDGGIFTDMLNDSVIVTLSCETDGAIIYYTLSSPGVGYPDVILEYTEPIILTFTTTIRASAWREGMEESEALQVTFTDDVFNGTVATPTATPDGGMFTGNVTVTLSCETEGAEIHYYLTSPDTDYSSSSSTYTEPFTLHHTTTITAYAYRDGMDESEPLEVTFTRDPFGFPPTGIADMTGYAIALLACLVTAVGLWGYSFFCRYRRSNS
ncbi:MAG: chitobiase/beta-hexosaminidase C-terminal domain-containing protein [Defluviitaleaceae bacterium]|nr:chitobiase/beta-hexosaminidase C-terminal domain-containing protein [Defluviitaleaceae bacterium]